MKEAEMEKNTAYRLEPRIYYYTFGPSEPALRVQSGDTVTAKTLELLLSQFSFISVTNFFLPKSHEDETPKFQ